MSPAAERARHSKASSNGATKPSSASNNNNNNSGQPSNRLLRETPFICHVKFKNDLPEVPGEPKMLVAGGSEASLAAFSISSLERQLKRNLIVPPDVGIALSVLDMQRFTVDPNHTQLDPEDADLLKDDDMPAGKTAGPSQVRRSTQGKSELPFLMRTKYISNDNMETKALAAVDRGPQPVRSSRAAAAAAAAANFDDMDEDELREAAIREIEATFDAAKGTPVHNENAALQPKHVWPVLPDFDMWVQNFVSIKFDGDPLEDIPKFARLQPQQQHWAKEHAALKSYVLGQTADKKEKFLAYLLPEDVPPVTGSEPPLSSSSRAMNDVEPYQGDYHWVREYNYTLRQALDRNEEKRPTYCFFFDETSPAATYVDLNTTITLSKRRRDDNQNSVPFERPSKVVVTRRELTDEEAAEQANKQDQLYGVNTAADVDADDDA